MPWEKNFDRTDALEASMLTFWEKGFERTSISDLSRATGASRYGLYDEFGDKQSLYLAALDFYRDQFVSAMLGSLETKPEAGLADIKSYFRRLYETPTSPKGALGCFMSLSAIDLAPVDPTVADRVRKNFGRVRVCLARALENARAKGEWPEDKDTHATASALLGLIQGAAIFQRAGEPPEDIVKYLRTSITLLI